MEKSNVVKFLNQLIKTIKQDEKNIGIITDKDGTILLNDMLKETLRNFKEKNLGVNVYVIANSGRTIQDMIYCLEQEGIPKNYFDYIIGDNGAMCLEVKTNKQLYKNMIDKKIVLDVIKKFIDNGADASQIRITNGENIFAYPIEKVREYYEGQKDVIYKEDMLDLESIDITKLTLSGPHEQIREINKYIKQKFKGYKTHIGKTNFPNKSENNYRLDFTGKHTKGEAAKTLKKELGLDTCIYLGNDLNDITMFSTALDNDDFIVIASHEHKKITEMLVDYLKQECATKGVSWEDTKILVLEEENVNNFLNRISKIMAVLNSKRKQNNMLSKYRINMDKKSKSNKKRNIPNRNKKQIKFYR